MSKTLLELYLMRSRAQAWMAKSRALGYRHDRLESEADSDWLKGSPWKLCMLAAELLKEEEGEPTGDDSAME